MKKISLIALSLIITSSVIYANADEITVPVPNNNTINVETVTQDNTITDIIASQTNKIDEVYQEQYDDEEYEEYDDEQIPFDEEGTQIIEKNEIVVLPSDSKLIHPLLSMNFDDSLFNKLSQMEQSKFTIDIQTKTKQAELELAKLKRDQLKIDAEIKKLEGKEEAPVAVKVVQATVPQEPVKEIKSEDTVQTEDSSKTNEVTGDYELKSITGVGGNLIATIKNTKQNKKINVRVGTKIGDNIIVKSISATDGLTLEKDKQIYPLKIQQD